jgi:hypothetical protein
MPRPSPPFFSPDLDLHERVRLLLCRILAGFRSRRGSISIRRIRYTLFGTDECADSRLCYEVRKAIMNLIGGMAELGLARIDGKNRKRVSFTDVSLAMAVLRCDNGRRPS